ncbi:MAG: hypothetical protein HUU38_24265 [Anaerolineales bacterium]|nr:hypothetical protein [Anaerolineales bacterium]
MSTENYVPNIIFEKPPLKWLAVGLLKDHLENSFYVFVSGARKRDVNRFISQTQTGEVRISVEIIPETEIKPFAQLTEILDDDLPSGNISMGGVQIGISRFHIKVKPPYRIRYTIDPPISRPREVRDVFETTFDDQISADVRCEVDRGSVRITLEELSNGSTLQSGSQDVRVGFPVEFHTPKSQHFRGNWRIRVRGLEDNSYFKLSFDKVVF